MVYVGIDLGGTSIKAGLVDEQGKILCKATCPTLVERGARPVVDDMAKLSLEVIEKGGYTLDDVKAIGVGLPGIQDPRTGIVPFCTNLYWHEVPVIEWMQETINKPIYIGNDATVAGLAESVAGVSAGIENSVFLTLGTGVGGGIVLGGKVYSGTNGVGSELGHMITVIDGELCTCGNRGCVESYCAASALARDGARAMQDDPSGMMMEKTGGNAALVDAKLVVDCAKAGDVTAKRVFDAYVGRLSSACASIFNTLDPEVLAIGGGLCGAGEFLFAPVLREGVDAYIHRSTGGLAPGYDCAARSGCGLP